jgi:hypothetical protein
MSSRSAGRNTNPAGQAPQQNQQTQPRKEGQPKRDDN